jgi:Secretion system C-terminal sorting domain
MAFVNLIVIIVNLYLYSQVITPDRARILDIHSKLVLSKEYDGFVQNGKLNISILANGTYIIKYSCGNNEMYREKFVINK